ncbi:MAG: cupin domain-containing protein [Bacteroidales bacterium]|nr:cupin domain-containing protein [Bacteroidales bacterium]
MIRRQNEMEIAHREHVLNGEGTIISQTLLRPDQMSGKSRLCARNTLPPHSSIGQHPHTIDAEIYYILEGEATVCDNGKEMILHAGDVMFTANGETHSIANNSDKNVVFLAIILE